MGRLTKYFINKLTESNLLLSEKAIVLNSTVEETYKKVYQFLIRKRDSFGWWWNEHYHLYPQIFNEPEFILIEYNNRTNLLYRAIPIDSYVMISFAQNESNVIVTVDMYRVRKSFYDFGITKVTRDIVRLTWVDFILEVFKAADADDYERYVSRFLSDDVLRKRDKAAVEWKKEEYKGVLFFLVIMFACVLLAYFLGKVLN